jgi:hypothetical protein
MSRLCGHALSNWIKLDPRFRRLVGRTLGFRCLSRSVRCGPGSVFVHGDVRQ